MNSIAFVFKTPPHGASSGREGLDALLATAALTEDIGVFFIGEGVFHLVAGQQPSTIFARDYIATFKLLELYDIEQVYACQYSMVTRGISERVASSIPFTALTIDDLQQRLSDYDKIISF
ncbi:sulfurtransferase complex subunit TusC [Tatumella sp. TA1]|uniref:sulfurtransferase complex subunit TusC n=1 Tax=Rosenbergiella collisarenosi TaxID=1544695 RepID=UPI0008F7EE34|nr:sulfurtransferase complex subunit TusC [Rosenbergiella collisarenosi]MBT0722152.1 sulfurtransferase complex subunit TusC [Rosenbergiella collisarenosi]QGX90239.1 sulfurtransferase complex subunit TusC [Tatumella sp. TA1]